MPRLTAKDFPLRDLILRLSAGNLQCCPDRAWRDNIHPNTFLRDLFCQATAVVQNRRLRSRIVQ